MKSYLKVILPLDTSIEIEPLWTIEGGDSIEMAFDVSMKKALISQGIPFEEIEVEDIDWESQWASFAMGAEKDGVYEIDLEGVGSVLLKPGPGFGNLSHPTTRLMLKMMQGRCPHKTCIDIGCGSGVLSIAAAFLGASQVFAYDIDPEANTHTQENAALNHLEGVIQISRPDLFTGIILINMIESEQREAFPTHFKLPLEVISSGIMTEDKSSYLNWMESKGFILRDTLESEGWSSFYFSQE